MIPGVRAIDAGPLDNARLLESAAALLISLNLRHKVKESGMRITGLKHETQHSWSLWPAEWALRVFWTDLTRVIAPERVFIIGNTADDAEIHGLHISPDLDTVTYTLAGLANPQHGWGIRGDSFRCLEALGRLGADTWFQLGDLDLATHLYRTQRLRQGATLSEVTSEITSRAQGAFHAGSHVERTRADPHLHPVGRTGVSDLFREAPRARSGNRHAL